MLQANPQRKNQSNLPQDLNGKKLMKTAIFLKQQWLKLCTLMLVLMFSVISHAAISGVSLTVVTDGEAPFDVDDTPGNDSSSNNGIVRTRDNVTYRMSYTSSSVANTKFVFSLPPGAIWDGSSTAASLCNGTGGGSISNTTLTCNRLTNVGAESFTLIISSGIMANGTLLTPSVAIDGGSLVMGDSVKISAAPKSSTRLFVNTLVRETLNGIAGYTANMNFGIGIDREDSGNSKEIRGAESLKSGTEFQISTMPGAYLTSACTGALVCSQPEGPGTPILVTLNQKIDFESNSGYDFFSPPAHIGYYHPFKIFAPIDPKNTPEEVNDDNFPLGEVSYFSSQILAFNPDSISGQSNFGAGYAPEMDPSFTCDSPADNLNFYKSYACGSVKVSRTAIEPTMKEIFSVVTEQDNISNLLYGDNSAQNHGHPYSESVLPGQSFMAYTGFYSDNAGFGSFSEAGECVLFDNKLINLNALPTIKFGSNVTSAQSANSLLNGSDMTVEYTNHKLNSDNDRRNYDCGVAGDGNGAWSSDLGSVGGIRKVTAVRYKYNKPLEPSEGLVMGLPFERAVTEDSLNLTDGTPIAWFAHRSHKNDISNVSTVKQSSYNPAPGSSAPIYDGGRVTTQSIKIRHDTEVSPGSIAPNEQMSISITPRLIGAAATGVDAFAKNARVTVRFQDNCVIPTAESLPNNATLILGNYGPDGVPCTSDDGPASSVSFDLGDIPVTGGNAVAPYGGSMATLEPITFKALAVYTSSTSNKRLTTIISANNDLTNEFVNESFTEDRTELSSFVINGASSFGVLKSSTGVTGGKVGSNEIFGYTINFGNGGATNTGIGYFVDVLPFDGDDNNTNGLGVGKLKVTSLTAAMLTPEMGGVTIQYSTDPSLSVQNAVKVEGQEDGSKGINWVTYANGGIIPEGVTAIRFKTNQPILTNQSGLASIGIKAPTINSETNFTNKLWARTEQYGTDAGSFEVFRSVPVVTIQGLNSSSLRGKVYLDKNANGVFDDGELGVTSTVVKIECTLGACLTAPQGAIFSMMVDSNGVYAFSRDATNIFASADGSGTAIANFQGVISGTWTITETPPTNPATAISSTSIGTINGIASGEANGRSITGVKIGSDEVGVDYDFAERLLDGAIEVTNALTLPAGVTGPFDFTFTATCDLPVPNTQKSATLSYPSNTKVSITGIAANATCVVTEALPESPDSKYYWETPTFTPLNPVAMPNGGVQSIIATNVLSPTVKIEKSVTSPPTVVAGNPTQFDTTYRLTVSNTGENAQFYDLKDQFKFDSDVSLVGVPTIVKSENVSSVVNSAFTGSSTNTSIITGESIAAGTLATPSVETYDVTVRLTVPAGSDVSNNLCTGSAGQGLFNVATLSIAGASDLTAMACSDTPTVLATNLVLQKAWVDATVGEGVTIPATTGFSVNTAAFDATAEKPSSITSSDTVVLAVGDVGVLPVESFVVAANAINYNASAWSCFDGTTPALEIAQGGSLTIAAANAGKTLTCTLSNTSVVAGVNVTKTVATGPTPVAGLGDQFDVTYRISVSNTNPSATVYDLSDSLGFDADATVVGTPVITKSDNVDGVINADFTGTGTNTALVSTESIEAGSINTPTEETYEIAVRVKVPEIGNINNQLCTNAPGSGLFNKAQMTVAGAVKEATACVPTPAAKTSQLTLKVNWLNALVGETITIPGTTGLSNNTKAFDAVSSGSNAVTSDTTIALLNETVTLPTPSFAIAGNELFYGSPIAWVCTDEVNPTVNVAFGGSLTFDDKYDGRSVVCQVTYISVVADLTIDSEMITVGKEPIAGTEDEFNLIYRISVKNNNSSATVYSLRDRFAFDPNVSVVGMPVITKSDNVSEPVKAGFTGVGADTVLIDNENIAANSTETFDVAIRYKVLNLNSTETNACTNEEGFGLFHQSTLDIGSVSKTVNDCAATRMLKKIPVELAVEWLNAGVGAKVSVPAVEGLGLNIEAFDAVSSGSNVIKSTQAVTEVGTSLVLPTPKLVDSISPAFLFSEPANWVCTDGSLTETVAFGETLLLSNDFASSGDVLVCKVVYSGIQVNTVKLAVPDMSAAVTIGDSIEYTLKTTVTGSATQQTLVLLDKLDMGLTVDTLPSDCTINGQELTCTLPAGASVGEHNFTYKATVNATAVGKVTNQVLPDAGTCSACTVSHNLWSAAINKTSDAATKKAVRIGDTINYSLTTTVSGGASSRDIVLTDTLGVGLTLSAVPAGCRVEESVLSCTLAKGAAVGNHIFDYATKVNPEAGDTVVNSVVTNLGICTACSTSATVLKDVALLVTKVTKTKTAKTGDFVRYEVLIENPNPYAADGFNLIDQPAPGLSYVVGSMQIDGDADALVSSEYPLTTSGLNLASGEKITLSYMMRVGASAAQGRLQNCAQVGDSTGLISSNRSCADITRASDPDFEDNRVWGTVFEDSNGNGIQDEGESGIPGVRLATVEGLLIETDAYGRYHIEAIKPSLWARGSNFIVKVDISSLPEGSVPTTQNPLVKRLTQGLPGLFNFGFRVPFNAYEPNRILSFPVMLSADGLFEFDRFDLLEDGRRKLSDLAQHLKEDHNARRGIVVSAYTDRLGSDAYNQTLSIKRAQSIKAYLVKEGLDESFIRAEGQGSAQPLVQCSGKKSAKVIACLAPNRRFEVSVP